MLFREITAASAQYSGATPSICGLLSQNSTLRCWPPSQEIAHAASGAPIGQPLLQVDGCFNPESYMCGLRMNDSTVICWSVSVVVAGSHFLFAANHWL